MLTSAQMAAYRAHRAAGASVPNAYYEVRFDSRMPSYQFPFESILSGAYGRIADPAWRSCNTDAFCNTPRQLWAQAYWEARDFAHRAHAQQD